MAQYNAFIIYFAGDANKCITFSEYFYPRVKYVQPPDDKMFGQHGNIDVPKSRDLISNRVFVLNSSWYTGKTAGWTFQSAKTIWRRKTTALETAWKFMIGRIVWYWMSSKIHVA